MAALRCERLDGVVAVLCLDRPAVRNALDSAALAELEAALAEQAADDALRALVLSTTDVRGFCAGADVGEALDPSGVHVAAENAGLVAWQRERPGLP
jgi:enoyl-CoA hydratase/carnithine racemase